MPRPSRRDRAQSAAARKRSAPVLPRHLLERYSTTATQAPPITERPDDREDTAASAPGTREAAGVTNARPMVASTPARSAEESSTSRSPISKLASTDYGYVVGELKRIFITAAIVVILLLIVFAVHH